jgi:tetratricopeptide (TPR) repeat protein
VAKASAVLARGFARAGRMNAARRALFAGLKGVRSSGDRLREAGVLRELGHLRLRQGHFDAAIERYTSSLEIVRSLRARAHESACLADIGFVRTMLGDFRAAQMSLSLAIDTAEASGDVRAAMVALASLGLALAWMGDLTGASSALENVVGSPVAKTDAVLTALAGGVKAGLDARLGATEAAAAFLDGVGPLLKSLEDPADEAALLLLCGQCAMSLGRHGDAMALYTALRNAVSTGALAFLEAPMNLLGADVLRAHGDEPRACEILGRALRRAEEQNARLLVIQARLQLGRLQRGTDAGAEQLTRAMELLQLLTADLPDEMTEVLLASPLATRLRGNFSAERLRLLNV